MIILKEQILNTALNMWPKRISYRSNDLNANYADYSKRYWAGVKERARLYREARQRKNSEVYYGRF